MINQKLSILIILYEENLEIINKCLEKIKDFKVIIIDNANDKSLKNEITKNFKIYKYFLNKKNIGFSKAANQGIQSCDTEYLLFLGADCLITYSGIEQLMLAKEKYKNCFLTSPTFYDHSGKYTYNGGPLLEDGAKTKVIENSGDICVDAVLTTAILFKVKDIIEIGLLDEFQPDRNLNRDRLLSIDVETNKMEFKPFRNMDKKQVAQWVKDLGLLETLFPVTETCELEIPNYAKYERLYGMRYIEPGVEPCRRCWPCREKYWAYGYYDFMTEE